MRDARIPDAAVSDEVERLISKMIATTYHGDNWHADFRDDILAIVRAARRSAPAGTHRFNARRQRPSVEGGDNA